jgi:hypothetical protein
MMEESADMDHDHIHRGYKTDRGPRLAIEWVSHGVWHCVAEHSEHVVQCNAKLVPIPHFPTPQ